MIFSSIYYIRTEPVYHTLERVSIVRIINHDFMASGVWRCQWTILKQSTASSSHVFFSRSSKRRYVSNASLTFTQPVKDCECRRMSGRRLLDAAALLKAARGVATRFVAIQRHQLNIYSKTSSLTRAVRYQTGQSALKVGAGSVRVASSVHDSKEQAPGKETPVPSQASTNRGRKQVEKKSDLEQDHSYTKSEANTAAQPLPDSELGVTQEKPKKYPLIDGSISGAKSDVSVPNHDHDSSFETTKIDPGEDSMGGRNNRTKGGFPPVSLSGTNIPDPETKAIQPISDRKRELQRDSENQIPSVSAEPPNAQLQPEATPQDSLTGRPAADLEQDVFHTRSSKATRVLSSLPRVKLPKTTEDTQGGNSQVPIDQINQDVFYSSPSKNQQQPVPEVQAAPEHEQPSDDMYSEIFHSPRVAKLLKGERKQDSATNGLKLRAVRDTPVEHAKLSQEMDQESFNIRPTVQDPSRSVDHHNVTGEPRPSKKDDAEDAHKLAEAMAQDVVNASSVKPEVSIDIHLHHEIHADKLTVIL